MEKPGLVNCVAMDAVGMFSYLLPGIGEAFDFVWAFVGAFMFYKYFKAPGGTAGAFMEEMLPMTDFVPSFTLGYFLCDPKD